MGLNQVKMRVSKIVISKIEGFLCLEYGSWPEDYLGFDRRHKKDRGNCPKSIRKTLLGKIWRFINNETENLA